MDSRSDIAHLLSSSPSIRLLGSRQKELIVTFLDHTFKVAGQSAVTDDRLLLQLADYLEHKNVEQDEEYEVTEADTYEEKARKYLKKWTSDGYLTYFPDETGNRYYELSTHTEKVLQWLSVLDKKEFVGTESRFKDIFVKLKELVEYSSEDREKRIEELEKRKLEIENQIRGLKMGEEVAVYDTYQIKSRVTELNQSAKELLSDFKEVEENFKSITREIYKKHTNPELTKGSILEFTFDALNELQDSEQGKSFYAFWEFLLTRSRQNEWADLTRELYSMLANRDIEFTDPFLRRMKGHLHTSGKKVYESNDKMAEKISRVIGEKRQEDRVKMKEVIGGIKSALLRIEEHGEYPSLEMEIDNKPQVSLPLERKLTWEQEAAVSFSGTPQQAEDTLEFSDELMKVFSQFYVDKQVLKKRVSEALKHKGQVTLTEVIEVNGGIEKGLPEVFGYFSILEEFKSFKDDERTCMVLFDQKDNKVIEIPNVIISR
ncbi:MAG: DUF3375 domain-containing protein [Balneolales bacterium]